MKYYIFVVGCAMNHSDSERISGLLDMAGFKKAETEDSADILIAVSCSVRQSAVNRIYAKAESWKKKNQTIALTGCVLDADKKKLLKKFDYIFPIEDLGSFVKKLLDKKENDCSEDFKNKIGDTEKEYLSFAPKYSLEFRANVPIMTGCNNFCSYCAVPYVRGREKSRPEAEILAEIKELVARGVKEIILLGQNVNSYGQDFGSKKEDKSAFVELIKRIDKISGNFRVYFYSNHPKDISDQLITALPKLLHFPNYIHLPLQSGSDEVLKKMNRGYTQKDYLDLVKKIKKNIPNVTLTTDIMVGFPSESESDFMKTIKVMDSVDFGMAFIAEYSPRPETVSARMDDDVPKLVKRERKAKLQKVLAKSTLKLNKRLIGKKIVVLVDGKKNHKHYGRTESYQVVEIEHVKNNKKSELKIGEFYEVRVSKAEPWKLVASL